MFEEPQEIENPKSLAESTYGTQQIKPVLRTFPGVLSTTLTEPDKVQRQPTAHKKLKEF